MGRPSKGRATTPDTPVVILVRPQLGENIGMAARAMLNCGLSRLRLVAPRDGWPNVKAQRAASGADIVLDETVVFDSLAEAVADLEHVVGTSARNRELSQRIVTARHAAGEMRDWIGQGETVGILFGPERTGLTNDDMVHADTALSIPLNPQFSSLNIAQAVLLFGYGWYRLAAVAPAAPGPGVAAVPATKAVIGGLVDHLVRELDAVSYFRAEERRASLIRTITVMIERRQWTESEAHLMRGIIKDLVGGRRARQKPTDGGG